MYAVDSVTNIFHRVIATGDRTLCGQAVAPIVLAGEKNTSILHLTHQAPEDREECPTCREMQVQRESTDA